MEISCLSILCVCYFILPFSFTIEEKDTLFYLKTIMSLKCHVFCILYVTSDEEYKDIECNAISLYDCQHYSMDHKAPIVR